MKKRVKRRIGSLIVIAYSIWLLRLLNWVAKTWNKNQDLHTLGLRLSHSEGMVLVGAAFVLFVIFILLVARYEGQWARREKKQSFD